MYVGMVDYRVRPGQLEEAVRFWREQVEPVAAEQPGYEGSMLLAEPQKDGMVGFGFWESKAHADEFATTGPWREGSELMRKFADLLSGEPPRDELKAAYLNAPQSL
jgi:antibiotic biosynthesis monooxygenase (ABM) superfamily enzyme